MAAVTGGAGAIAGAAAAEAAAQALSSGVDYALYRSSDQSNKDRAFNLDMYRDVRNEQRHAIRRRVEDARAAGVHPLFALGANLPSLPAISVGSRGPYRGNSDLGSAVKNAIQFGYEKSRLEMEKAESASRVKANQARALADEALAAKYHSDVARAAQSSNYAGPGVIVSKLAEGGAISRRPLLEQPRQSIPKYIEMIGPGGRHRVLNPDSNFDEAGQFQYYYEQLDNAIRALRYFADGPGRWERGSRYLRKRRTW